MKVLVAVGGLHKIDASGLEVRVELDDPVFLRKDCGPYDHGDILSRVCNAVHLTRPLYKSGAGRDFLRLALGRPNDVGLGQSAVGENDIARPLMEMPRNGFAGIQRESLD